MNDDPPPRDESERPAWPEPPPFDPDHTLITLLERDLPLDERKVRGADDRRRRGRGR